MKQFYQCRLQRNGEETTAWIEARGAKVGAEVELLPVHEFWTVAEVFTSTSMDVDTLKETQRLNRRSLPSIEAMA
jgi:hypothetical protein